MWRQWNTKTLVSLYGTSEDRCLFRLPCGENNNKKIELCRIKLDHFGDITIKILRALFS